jgi:hypothetical protein
VLRRQIHRSALQPTDRAVLSALWPLLARCRKDRFVQPATVPRWHPRPGRQALKRWTYPQGRPAPVTTAGTLR